MDTKWKDKNKVNNFILAHIPQAYMQIYALHCSSRVCVYVHLDIHVFLIYFWTEWLTNKWMYTECNEEERESVCAQKVKKTRILTIFFQIQFNNIVDDYPLCCEYNCSDISTSTAVNGYYREHIQMNSNECKIVANRRNRLCFSFVVFILCVCIPYQMYYHHQQQQSERYCNTSLQIK